jgi:purine-nucleoside phosphorylase
MKAGIFRNSAAIRTIPSMNTWEEKFVRFMAERWVFQGTDPHEFRPRVFVIGMGEDFISPLLQKHKHFGAFYTGYLAGRLVGYMRVPPGTVILEGLMRALQFTRVDTVIGLGTCGALQPDIELGDVVVAESAFAGDGLSSHYGFESGSIVPADEALAESVGQHLRRRGLPVFSGRIITNGAAFRETDEEIEKWQQEGMLGIELETSCLYALAKYQNLKAAAVHFVTDSPVRRETSAMVLKGEKRHRMISAMVDFIGSTYLAQS